jgi:hypothetical protein
MSKPFTLVSLDSHAQVPEHAWPTFLEEQYHHFLPRLSHENVQWNEVMGRLTVDRTHTQHEVFDADGAYRNGGLLGMFDCDTRLAQMDREGIAAEFVYNGEQRIVSLFFQPSSSKYPDDAVEAGVRAHHRWTHDEFGKASDRILLVGVTGHAPCRDMDATLAETRWIAEHGFVGLVAPGMTGHQGMPPLYDAHWDPLWRSSHWSCTPATAPRPGRSSVRSLRCTTTCRPPVGSPTTPFAASARAPWCRTSSTPSTLASRSGS